MIEADSKEPLLEEATLGGVACMALAWVAVARYEADARDQKREAPAGRRAWKGMALLEGEGASKVGGWLNRAVVYAGMLEAGGERAPITADVYITSTRTEVRRGDGTAPPEALLRVEFSGAGSI